MPSIRARRFLVYAPTAVVVAAIAYALIQGVDHGNAGKRSVSVNWTIALDHLDQPFAFGIYPGGATGTVATTGSPKPEQPTERLEALKRLRAPDRPFVVHLYAAYTGPGGLSAAQQVGPEIYQYAQAGLRIELVATYRPADSGSPPDITGFDDFVRAAVQAFGIDRAFVSLQVGDEANVTNAPDASDGYYRGATEALVSGVIAAKRQIVSDGFRQIAVGFNWAYLDNSAQAAFWESLREFGGPAFANSVDWVGIDVYPGTWGPETTTETAGSGAADIMWTALIDLRQHYMPLAGLGARVALHISEIGYPTGPNHTEQSQAQVMRASIATVETLRLLMKITEYCWFDLRDADSAGPSLQDHYGLMTDDYQPKPAFSLYRRLIAAQTSGAAANRPAFPALSETPSRS